jgi:hypothetical protein
MAGSGAAHRPLRSPPPPEALSLQAAGQTLALPITDGVIAIISVISAATVKIHGNRQQICRLGPGTNASTAKCSPSASHERTSPEPDVPCRALG